LPYVTPPCVPPSIEDCTFYHRLDLPEGTVGGDWDLRATMDQYLGSYDFTGKRVLDVGTAGGALAFAMEQRGATQVVAFDMALSSEWDLLPFDSGEGRAWMAEQCIESVERIQNAFWYAHHALGSRVLRAEGSIYDLPEDLGAFDVVVFGMILPHLRDAFRALEALAPRTNAIIITQQMLGGEGRMAHWIPTNDARGSWDNWWVYTQDTFEAMLGILGFEVTGAVVAEHACPQRGDTERCTALVAERVSS
jgi:SAM-dependent methyltransferase